MTEKLREGLKIRWKRLKGWCLATSIGAGTISGFPTDGVNTQPAESGNASDAGDNMAFKPGLNALAAIPNFGDGQEMPDIPDIKTLQVWDERSASNSRGDLILMPDAIIYQEVKPNPDLIRRWERSDVAGFGFSVSGSRAGDYRFILDDISGKETLFRGPVHELYETAIFVVAANYAGEQSISIQEAKRQVDMLLTRRSRQG